MFGGIPDSIQKLKSCHERRLLPETSLDKNKLNLEVNYKRSVTSVRCSNLLIIGSVYTLRVIKFHLLWQSDSSTAPKRFQCFHVPVNNWLCFESVRQQVLFKYSVKKNR